MNRPIQLAESLQDLMMLASRRSHCNVRVAIPDVFSTQPEWPWDEADTAYWGEWRRYFKTGFLRYLPKEAEVGSVINYPPNPNSSRSSVSIMEYMGLWEHIFKGKRVLLVRPSSKSAPKPSGNRDDSADKHWPFRLAMAVI
eukprot:691681-Amphidinium_carterae.1